MLTGDSPPTEEELGQVFAAHSEPTNFVSPHDTISAVSPMQVKLAGLQPGLDKAKEVLFQPPSAIQNAQPKTWLGAAGKTVGEQLTPANMAMLFGGAKVIGEGLQYGTPLAKAAIKTGLAYLAAKGLTEGTKEAAQVAGNKAGGLPLSSPQQAALELGALGNLSQALPLAAPHLLEPQPLKLTPDMFESSRMGEVNAQGKAIWEKANLGSRSPAKVETPVSQTQQTAVTETIPQLQKPATTTENLGMLDQQFRHDVGNAMQIASLHGTAGNFSPVEVVRAQNVIKNIALQANEGKDMSAALADARSRIADVGAYNKNQRSFQSAISKNDEAALQKAWTINEQLKNKYGGMPPTIEGVNENAIQKPSTGTVLQREQEQFGGAGSQRGRIQPGQQGQEVAQESQQAQGGQKGVVQTAPENQVPGNVEQGTGGTRGVNGQGNAGLGSVRNQDMTAGQDAKYPLSTSKHEGKMVDAEGRTVDPKTHKTTGELGAIFPQSPLQQALTQMGGKGSTVVHPVVQNALNKLSGVKATANDIFDAVTDPQVWKARKLGFQRYDLPKTEAASPGLANAVSKYANSGTAALLRANAEITKVLGDKTNDDQFRKQLGGIIYEDMRQAEGGIGNSVLKLKNGPFANQAQYDAALKNPEMQAALQRWKQLIQAPATEMHQKVGGTLAESGKETGAFANLIAVMQDDQPLDTHATPNVGPLSTMKKASAFSKERKFTGQEYNLDARDMALRMLTKNAAEFNKRLVYEQLEKTGQGKLLKPGEDVPQGMKVLPNPVTLRSVVIKNADGSTDVVGQNLRLAVNERIAPEIKQAFQLNTNWKEWMKETSPALNQLSQAVIKTQVGLGIDLGFHTFNDMISVATSPKGMHEIPQKVVAAAKARSDLIANEPAVQEELAKMAESGVTFRGDSMGGWSSHVLKTVDTVTRLVLNREYEDLVKEGKVVDSPAERRRYINGRAGQYNKRMMTWFQQGMQETGLGAFNVAGRNFNRLAIGNLTMSPGVKAKTNVDALRLRLSIALGVATAAVVTPALINMATTGEPQPAGTELGDIVLFKNKDGTYKTINMRKWAMLERGGRASGLGKVMSEQVMPRLRGEQPATLGQTAKDSLRDMMTTGLAPYSGPPVNVASTLLTGKTDFGIPGMGYEQRTPGEKPILGMYPEAAAGSLNPLVGPFVGSAGSGKGTPLDRAGQRIGSIVGVQDSRSPLSIIRNRATQFKVRNNIHTDDSSFAPSEFIPLKQALLEGDTERAKEAYQLLLHDKAQGHPSLDDDSAKHQAMMNIQSEFSKMENFRFVNKESEAMFKASLSPEQRKMYDLAVQQQKDIANKFFAEIQGKMDNKKHGFQPPRLGKLKL